MKALFSRRLFSINPKRIVYERSQQYKPGTVDLSNWEGKPLDLKMINKLRWSKVRPQFNVPQKDYINFKRMSGNEILINLQHAQYLRPTELIGGLTALGRIPGQESHNWNKHPWTRSALVSLKKEFGKMKCRDLVYSALAFDRLVVRDVELWGKLATNILRIMHTLRSKDYFYVLNVFSKQFNPYLNQGSDDLMLPSSSSSTEIQTKESAVGELKKKKGLRGSEQSVMIAGVEKQTLTFGDTENERIGQQFFERLIAMLPIHLKNLSPKQITRLHEICSEKNIGSDELYEQFFYYYLEKYAQRFSNQDYARNLRSLALRAYQSDLGFWDDIFLPVIYERAYNQKDANDLRDTLIFLKFSCPFVNVKNVLLYLQDVLEKFEEIKGFDALNEEEKAEIKLRGKVPESETDRIRKKVLLKQMANEFEDSTSQSHEIQIPDEDEKQKKQQRKKAQEKKEEKKLRIKLRRQKRGKQ